MARTTVGALLRSLATSDDVAYVLSSDRRLVRTNGGWARFARANGGEEVLRQWPVGRIVDDAIPAVLRPFYIDAFRRALASGARWEHDYECSSPTHYRRFRMVVYPVPTEFLVVVNSPILETPHTRPVVPPDADSATGPRSVVTMCSHCRRVRRAEGKATWDWVPAYVARMPANLSHGLCEACSEFYAVV